MLRTNIRVTPFLLPAVAAVLSLTLFQSASAQTAQDVLTKFVKLDFDGARLDSDGFKKVFPLTDWPDAPGYDSAIIIKSYKIGAPTERSGKTFIPVTYEVVGFMSGNVMWEAYADNPNSESFKDQVKVNYELVSKKGQWKVHEPDTLPHISVAVALKNEEALLAEAAAGSDEQKSYQKIVNALRNITN